MTTFLLILIPFALLYIGGLILAAISDNRAAARLERLLSNRRY